MTTLLASLTQSIDQHVSVVEESLQSQNAPMPSFDIDAPIRLPTTGDAEVARKKAIQAAEDLVDLLKGPAELTRADWTQNSSLRIIHRFDIARKIPVGEEVPFSTLASKTGLPERDIRRVLRHAMTRHIFTEPRKGYVAHTAMSRLIAEDSHYRDVSSTVSEVLWPALQHTADALARWPGSEESEHTGFSLAHESRRGMYATFSEREEMGRRFGVFIGNSGAQKSLIDGIEWKGRLVDIGGSHGHAMVDVLRKYPAVESAVIQDLPDVVEAGAKKTPKDVEGRLRFEAYDFFKPQTVEADIYFLRWILHNWSDKYSVKILRNLIPVMKPGTKIIINDYMLPDPNTLPPEQEKGIRMADMTMLGLLNSTERHADDWYDLFAKADPRFRIESIQVTPPGIMGIVTVGWCP